MWHNRRTVAVDIADLRSNPLIGDFYWIKLTKNQNVKKNWPRMSNRKQTISDHEQFSINELLSHLTSKPFLIALPTYAFV